MNTSSLRLEISQQPKQDGPNSPFGLWNRRGLGPAPMPTSTPTLRRRYDVVFRTSTRTRGSMPTNARVPPSSR